MMTPFLYSCCGHNKDGMRIPSEIYDKEFKIGYQVVLLSDGGWLGKKIEALQMKLGYSASQAQATHVATYVGKQKVSEAVWPKATVRTLESYKGRKVALVRPRFATKQELCDYMNVGRYHIALASNTQLNKYYGVLSLLWWPLHFVCDINWLTDLRWLPFAGNYCSTKEIRAIEDEYPDFSQRRLWKSAGNVVPADYLNGAVFEVVWEEVV
jgi:hypothetical protein